MKNKELMKISQMPYYGTKVTVERSRAEIMSLLNKYEIPNYQWTTIDSKETLRFIVETLIEDKELKIAVELEIPEIVGILSGKKQLVPINQRYRMFFYSLKSLLEATKYGIIRKEDIFFSYIRTQLNGEVMTVKKAFFQQGNQNLLSPIE